MFWQMMPPKWATNSKNKFPHTLELRSHLKDKLEIFSLFSNLYFCSQLHFTHHCVWNLWIWPKQGNTFSNMREKSDLVKRVRIIVFLIFTSPSGKVTFDSNSKTRLAHGWDISCQRSDWKHWTERWRLVMLWGVCFRAATLMWRSWTVPVRC